MLLENSGVNPSDLLFNNDPSAVGFKANMTQMVLTDHNSADGEMTPYGDLSIQIFDHHIDQGDYPWIQGDDRDIAFVSIFICMSKVNLSQLILRRMQKQA